MSISLKWAQKENFYHLSYEQACAEAAVSSFDVSASCFTDAPR